MAPSFEIGNPQRSLVRIPGSGLNKTMKPVSVNIVKNSCTLRNLSLITQFNLTYQQTAPPRRTEAPNKSPIARQIQEFRRLKMEALKWMCKTQQLKKKVEGLEKTLNEDQAS